MLRTNIFSISLHVYYPIRKNCNILATLKLPSANAFNLDKAKILSASIGLTLYHIVTTFDARTCTYLVLPSRFHEVFSRKDKTAEYLMKTLSARMPHHNILDLPWSGFSIFRRHLIAAQSSRKK